MLCKVSTLKNSVNSISLIIIYCDSHCHGISVTVQLNVNFLINIVFKVNLCCDMRWGVAEDKFSPLATCCIETLDQSVYWRDNSTDVIVPGYYF